MLWMLHCISGLVSPQHCKKVIIYAYKAHKLKHNIMFYQAFSRKMCIRGKKIRIIFTLLHMLQAEKYAPLDEKFFFKCLKCL